MLEKEIFQVKKIQFNSTNSYLLIDDWLLARHERLKWRYLLTRADETFASAQASALSLLPLSITQRALSGDEGIFFFFFIKLMLYLDVLSELPVKKSIVRVFTSSTFTDTKLERNLLMRDVFPFLSRLCRKLGLTFEIVDMRWVFILFLFRFINLYI